MGGLKGTPRGHRTGIVNVTLAGLKRLGIPPINCRVVVQGFGNVGAVSANLIFEQGAKVIVISDISGGYINEEGIDIPDAITHT